MFAGHIDACWPSVAVSAGLAHHQIAALTLTRTTLGREKGCEATDSVLR